MNLRKVARAVSAREGGKVNLPIAQICEVQKCLLLEYCNHTLDEIDKARERTQERYGAREWIRK